MWNKQYDICKQKRKKNHTTYFVAFSFLLNFLSKVNEFVIAYRITLKYTFNTTIIDSK